jgi:membrane protease YdiL (CAAX protease family)
MTRRATWLEIGVVVLLICAPTLASLGCSLFWGSDYQKLVQQRRRAEFRTATAFETFRFGSMVIDLRSVALVLFVMWRSGERWSRFGLVKPKLGKDILLGLGLWLVVAVARWLLGLALNARHPELGLYPAAVPFSGALLLVGWSCAVGFSEELACRAYLIPRLEAVTGNTWMSIVLSVALFGFVHQYQGYVGVIYSVECALVWGFGFCFIRRIWPLALSHALTDFIIDTHVIAAFHL